jgi:MFS family permease
VLSAACAFSGLAVIAVGFAPDIVIPVVAMVLAGLFWEVYFVVSQTAIPMICPPEVVGSEVGLFYALTLGGLALGAPLLGLLVDATSVRMALSISGGLMVLVALWRGTLLRRRLRAQAGADDSLVAIRAPPVALPYLNWSNVRERAAGRERG